VKAAAQKTYVSKINKTKYYIYYYDCDFEITEAVILNTQ
jgi:hypothetical protein